METKKIPIKYITNGKVLAVTLSLMALLLQIILQYFTNINQWLFFYPAIFFTAWFKGSKYGHFATAISCLLALFFLSPPFYNISSTSYVSLIEISILAILGLTTSHFIGNLYNKYIQTHLHTEELEKSREYLDLLIENIPLMVFVKDASDLKFLRFNKAGEDLLGISRKDLIGKSDYDFFPKNQADSFIAKDREVISGKSIVDIKEENIQSHTLGPRVLHTKKIPLFGKDGKPLYLLGVSEDITEKKKNEVEIIRMLKEEVAVNERELIVAHEAFLAKVSTRLSASLNYHETLTLLADLSVTALGDWCTVSIVNDEGVFERAAGAHIDKNKTALLQEYINNYPPHPKVFTVLNDHSYFDPDIDQAQLKSRTLEPRRWDLLCELGASSLMIVPIRARGKIRGSLAFIAGKSRPRFTHNDLSLAEDLGRRAGIAIENAILYSSAKSAIDARDEFVSIASHELKTPITSLKIQLQMLIRGINLKQSVTPTPEKLFRSLTSSINQVDRLTVLIEELLDVTRIESGKLTYKFENVNLSKLVKEVDERFAEEIKNTKCALTEDLEENVMISCDRFRIEQVLENLISNAIKYGANNPITMTLRQGKDGAEIFVKDSGMGIAKEMQSKIFERFERAISSTNISGLGLGLYISKQIIDGHKGFIEIESEPGKGSIFKVFLPKEL